MATKRKKSASKRISAALSRYLKKLNPAKMRGVTHMRVKKLKNGGATFTPVHGRRRRR
jgi:porphobilinogen deaminase